MFAAPIEDDRWRLITEVQGEIEHKQMNKASHSDVTNDDSKQTPTASHREPPTLEDLRKTLKETAPEDMVISKPVWLSYFRVSHRIIDRFRYNRVFFAGDAAHIHSPVGGHRV